MNRNLGNWLRWHWDRTGAWLCVAGGAVALIIGWVGVSGNGYPADQLPYIISGGVGGVFLLGLGAMLWLSADLRDEWLKLDRLEQKLDEVAGALRQSDHGLDATDLALDTRNSNGASRADGDPTGETPAHTNGAVSGPARKRTTARSDVAPRPARARKGADGDASLRTPRAAQARTKRPS